MKRGDGGIYLRGNTYWCRYSLRGKQYRESTGETDPDKADKCLKSRLKEVHADQIGARQFVEPKNEKLTVHDLIEALRADYALRGKLSGQSAAHLNRVDEDFGTEVAVALTSEAIDRYIRKRVERGNAPSTINRVTQLLGQSYKLAVRRNRLHRAPAITHLSVAGNERQGFFSEKDMRRLLVHLPADVRDFVLFAYLTGMRKGEIASLVWRNVEADTIRLPGKHSKNGEARLIPLEGELKDVIERRRAARQIEVNGTIQLAEHIFHRDGESMAYFRRSWKTAAVKAGLGAWVCENCETQGPEKECPACERERVYRGVIFHDTRRSAVRNMVQAGVAPQIAMKISGHKTDSMFRRYSIIVEDDLRKALARTEKYRKAVGEKVVRMQGRKSRTSTELAQLHNSSATADSKTACK